MGAQGRALEVGNEEEQVALTTSSIKMLQAVYLKLMQSKRAQFKIQDQEKFAIGMGSCLQMI